MSKAYIFLADGHEEIEALTVVDLCRRAGIEIVTVSITGNEMVTSSHKVTYRADILFENADFSDADITILPGGMPGTLNLEKYEPLMKLIDERVSEGQNIAAICAAPTVFGRRGILKGRKACCYPGMENDLLGADVNFDSVNVDGNIITSRGMGTAIDFGLAIIEKITDKETADKIAEAIVYGGRA